MDRWATPKISATVALVGGTVDNHNTLYADAWAVFDLRSRWRLSDTVSVFAEVSNLFDTHHASSTLIVDQARADQAAFMPGDGRGVHAGVNVDF